MPCAKPNSTARSRRPTRRGRSSENFQKRPRRKITGRVVFPDGRPAPGATIYGFPGGELDEDARFTTYELCESEIKYVAATGKFITDEGYVEYVAETIVVPGMNDIDITDLKIPNNIS